MKMHSHRPILLVEDDEIDVMTVQRALRELKVANTILVARDGEDALAQLRAPNAERPCIILLDLNLPRLSGLEVLQVVKADSVLRRIPVVILTSSRQEQDRLASFDHSVAGYMVKPVSYQQFLDVIRTIDLYWSLSELSPEG